MFTLSPLLNGQKGAVYYIVTISVGVLLAFLILSKLFTGSDSLAAPSFYSTYLGGSPSSTNTSIKGSDFGRDIAVDKNGFVYVTGGTGSQNFPTTPGAYDTSFEGSNGQHLGGGGYLDVYVSKFDPSGSLVCSTLLGGSDYDRAYGIEVDNNGYVYVGGRAGVGFPTTPNSAQPNFAGDTIPNTGYGWQDGFVAKLTDDCSTLVWATYLGTSEQDTVRDIALDPNGNVYAGLTGSSPTAINNLVANSPISAQRTHAALNDGMVVKLNTLDGSLAYATFVGGNSDDGGTPAIRVNNLGQAYYLMGTMSTDLLVSPNIQPQLKGLWDLHLTKIEADGGAFLNGTYYGGSGNDWIETHTLALDSNGEIYIAGTTQSSDLPMVAGQGFNTVYGGNNTSGAGNYAGDGFIAKITPDFSTLISATYLGSSGGDGIQGIAVDSTGVYVSGATLSSGFPINNPIQSTKKKSADGFVVKMSPDLKTLLFGTFAGGDKFDELRSLDIDSAGNVYSAGHTTSTNFPVSVGAYDTTANGAQDIVWLKINLSATASSPTPTPTPTNTPTPTPSPPSAGNNLTVYSSVGDGRVAHFGASNSGCSQSTWTTGHDALSAGFDFTTATRSNWAASLCSGISTVGIGRGFLAFDTSALPDNATIISATLQIFVTGKQNSKNDGSDFVSIVQGLQASTSSLVGGDYILAGDSVTNPTEGSNRVDITNIVTNAYNTWTLNATGMSWVSKTGFTKLAAREGHDILNIWPSYTTNQGNGIHVVLSEQTGQTQDPQLIIFYQ